MHLFFERFFDTRWSVSVGVIWVGFAGRQSQIDALAGGDLGFVLVVCLHNCGGEFS